MKLRLIPVGLVIFLLGCSGGEEQKGVLALKKDSVPVRDTSGAPAQKQAAAKPAGPTKAFCEFLEEAKKMGYVPADTATVFGNSCSDELFGLVAPQDIFTRAELKMLGSATVHCLRLKKNSEEMNVAEWRMASGNDVVQIIDAMSVPMKDRSEVRFTNEPFSFWQKLDRIYYFRTKEEKHRTDLNKLSEKLAEVVTKFN